MKRYIAILAAVLLLVGGYYYRIHKISVRLKAENPAQAAGDILKEIAGDE